MTEDKRNIDNETNINDFKKKTKENKKEFKNLYYVEEIRKKIFVLFYFHEKKMKEKIKKDIKDIYNFKKYYLINSQWLNEYKEFFSYDIIIKKLRKYEDYSYNRIKTELNYIAKQGIRQIKINGETKISEYLRDASNLIFENNQILSTIDFNDFQSSSSSDKIYNTPKEFELIDEDIYELLLKEEFLYNINKDIKNLLSYEILLGNNQIIIKNKKSEEEDNIYNYSNNYLIYTKKELENKQNEENNKYILKYILSYDKKDLFYSHYSLILREGLDNYIECNKNYIDINLINCEQAIKDEKKNVIANFINIGLNENDIVNSFNINNSDKDININENINLNEKSKSLNSSKSTDNNDLSDSNQSIIDKNKNININNFIFTQLKDTVNILENLLYNNNLNIFQKNNNQIDSLCLEEIIESINNKKLKNIILINENDLNKIRSIVNNDLINTYLNSNEDEKNGLILKNEKEFSKICEEFNDFSLINNIIEQSEESITNNKFFIFQNLKQNLENNLYYFTYNNESYIFFEKEKKTFKIIAKNEDNSYTLKKFDNYKLEQLKYINNIIDKNRNKNNLNEKTIMNNDSNYIEEYYLINHSWIKEEINLKEKNENNINKEESIKPKRKVFSDNQYNYLKYPFDFGFVKKTNNETIINNLIDDNENTRIEDICSEMFFVNWNNIQIQKEKSHNNKVYIGIIDNNNKCVIYFYLFDQDVYLFEFVLQFYDEEIMREEIKTKIKTKGIGFYLIEMGINLANRFTNYDLINEKMDIIGFYINNCKIKNDDISVERMISKSIKKIENYDFINGVLIGLINLEPIKKIFLNKNILKNLIDNNSKYTQYLYELIQDFYLKNEDKNYSENKLIVDCIKKIREKNNSNNIYNNIILLIEFLLLNLHNEQKRDNNGKKLIDNKIDFNAYFNFENLPYFYQTNKSFIQESFFLKR